MIPDDWQPCRRASDGELTGYLVAAAGSEGPGAELVVPMSLVGTALSEPVPLSTATDLLTSRGLAVLADAWWCRLPDPLLRPLPSAGVDASDPPADWDWRRVVIVEASPTHCHVRPEMPAPEEFTFGARLTTPVGTVLRVRQPA